MATKQLPQCVGEYEPDHSICDGDPKGETDFDKAACLHRDRCAAFKSFLAESGKRPEDYVDLTEVKVNGANALRAVPKDADKLEALMDEQRKRFGIKSGRVTKTPVAPKPAKKSHRPSKRALRAARKALQTRKRDRRAQLLDLFKLLKANLTEAIPGRRFATRGHAIAPGDLHVTDRLDKSNYASVYCKTRRGRDAPVVLAKLKPRTLTLDLEIPVTPEQLAAEVGQVTYKKLAPKHIGDGAFKSLMPNLDREGIALAAEAIGRLVSKGSIQLPEA